MSVFQKILRAGEGRTLKRMEQRVRDINALEPEFEALSDEQLAAKTIEFRERFDQGEDLDELLPEAFAAVREASKRTLGLRHFDVQMIGGMVLHEGKIAEMKTGEGKTLVATLPLYLNALAGVNVHLVTVNDYLARRDAAWMGPVYQALGIPRDLFTPVFAVARVAGWLAHWLEQLQNNRIFRPEQVYVGKTDVPYVPLEQRV